MLGAPEALLEGGPDASLRERAASEAAAGRRVLALASYDAPLPEAGPEVELTSPLRPLGVVVLAEELRASAAETIAFFARENVALKVLSGDNPATVGAIARDLGIEASGPALDGRALPEDDAELLAAVLAAPAIGRISPEDKARVVRVLSEGGEYVGMLGDGVNDVPALKEARLAIAQGSGTQMARSVSDLVLVSGEFGEVPPMVGEGRQILRNIQRVARLFVSKAVFTGFLVLVIAIPSGVFPMLPRQFTLTSTFTIGIPAFLLALAPSSGPWRPEGFLRAIARFSIPAGLATGLGILVTYLLARHAFDVDLTQARSATAATVVVSGLAIVFALEDQPGTAAARRRRALRDDGAALLRRLRDPGGARILRNRRPDRRHGRRLADRLGGGDRAARGGAADRRGARSTRRGGRRRRTARPGGRARRRVAGDGPGTYTHRMDVVEAILIILALKIPIVGLLFWVYTLMKDPDGGPRAGDGAVEDAAAPARARRERTAQTRPPRWCRRVPAEPAPRPPPPGLRPARGPGPARALYSTLNRSGTCFSVDFGGRS